MSEMRYTQDHAWARRQPGGAAVGMTSFAADLLGPITALHLPRPGQQVQTGEACVVVESVKASSDIGAPVAGRVTRINAAIADDPGLVSRDPEGEGWLYEMAPDDPDAISSLMDAAAYQATIQAL